MIIKITNIIKWLICVNIVRITYIEVYNFSLTTTVMQNIVNWFIIFLIVWLIEIIYNLFRKE